mmetsp:Transcript_26125/g.60065  ORF Transcript_26125/g.60065 Transcript_26125/m.60065 type:complete len:389 (+) Transcript_26125:754-1920(+)
MRSFLTIILKCTRISPFFTYLALGTMHVPYTPPERFIDGTKIKGRYDSDELNILYELDLVVGYVVSSLKRRGLLDNTLIIFMSDNGGGRRNGILKGRKGTIWEGGNTIPLIMQYGNAFQGGAIRNQLVGITDIYATLADFAGIKVATGQAKDSRSLLKAVHNRNIRVRDDFIVLNYTVIKRRSKYSDLFGDQPLEISIRTDRYKLIYKPKEHFVLLFDLKEDPSESQEICSKKYQLCMNLYVRLLNKGPCREIESSWCPRNCQDDSDFHFKNFKSMDCGWIRAKPKVKDINTWCSYKVKNSRYGSSENLIRNYCKRTCGVCYSEPSHCSDSSSWKRWANGQNCDWVAIDPHQRCGLSGTNGIKAHMSCIKACNDYEYSHYKGFCKDSI